MSSLVALEPPLTPALDPGVRVALDATLESDFYQSGGETEERLAREDNLSTAGRDPCRAEGLGELDRRLSGLCNERGPLRVVLARVAFRLVYERAWERIGYARLSDYAAECLGISARSVQSLAEVGTRFGELPGLQQALASGTLGWTRVRLLARLPRGEDERPWIAYARQVTAEELSKAVRAVDRGSLEAGAAEEEGARSRLFEVRCTPEVRWKWYFTRSAAKRAAGRVLHVSEAAEVIAAEVLSALPIDEGAEEGVCDEAGRSWRGESECEPGLAPEPPGSEFCDAGSVRRNGASSAQVAPRRPRRGDKGHTPPAWPATPAETALGTRGEEALRAHRPRGGEAHKHPPWRVAAAERGSGDPTRPTPRPRRPFLPPAVALPPALASLLEGLEDADAFALDERFRRALSMEQRLEARIGPLLAVVWGRFLHRALGYRSREAYARERLGMDPTRARALVRLERAALLNEPFARAYRTGALSWVKAGVLAPLVSGELLGGFVEEWVVWAQRITVRRLRDDVERALALRETGPETFRRGGGLPPEARGDREIGAPAIGGRGGMVGGQQGDHPTTSDREIGAPATGGRGNVVAAEADRVAMGDRGIGAPAMDFALGHRHPGPLKSAPDEICWARFAGPADVVQLFKAVLFTVRRRIEKETGRLPTSGEALGVMLDHVLTSWGEIDAKVTARHKVFARDGWRCATPGCTSMQNLHDHHIRFRSAQGTDGLDNRISLCSYHHLRGVHAGLLRCVGKAPDGLRWELGIRPGVTPLIAYRSGDLKVPPMAR